MRVGHEELHQRKSEARETTREEEAEQGRDKEFETSRAGCGCCYTGGRQRDARTLRIRKSTDSMEKSESGQATKGKTPLRSMKE